MFKPITTHFKVGTTNRHVRTWKTTNVNFIKIDCSPFMENDGHRNYRLIIVLSSYPEDTKLDVRVFYQMDAVLTSQQKGAVMTR